MKNDIIRLIDKNFKIVPVAYKKKRPFIKEWQKLDINKRNFEEYFSSEKKSNIGVMNGAPSNGLTDIDLDDPDALFFAQYYLPKTDLIFGRSSNPKSHWYYICKTELKNKKYDSKEYGCILEIRSTGTQTVFPRSVHPSGETIEYFKDGDAASVDSEELKKACESIFCATIISKHYPCDGKRNDFALPLSNFALKLFDMNVNKAKAFVRLIAEKVNDEEVESRIKAVEYTASKIKNNERVQGLPTLAKFIGETACSDIAKLCFDSSLSTHDDITELNKEYAFVLIPPQSAIIKESIDKNGHRTFAFLQTNAFKQLLAAKWIGNKKLANAWIEDPLRRTYEGIEFAPSNPTKAVYNLFRGFTTKPAKGDCSLYLNHIKDVICDGNDEYYNFFIGWFSNIIQQPEDKPGTAIVIHGKQGTGKSIIFKIFGHLIAPHYKVADTERYIVGNFNSHLHDCLLLHLEEAFFAGDKKLEASIKEMITGDKVMMEYKGKEPMIANNFSRLSITTNADWSVPAGMEERRFMILRANDTKIQDPDYFKAIFEQMENGGYAALMDFLINFDISKIDLRNPPKTETLLQQKFQSFSPEEEWWFQILQEGTLPNQSGWSGVVGTQDMFLSYIEHTKLMNIKYKSASTKIGMFLTSIIPNLTKHKGSYTTTEDFGDEKRTGTYYQIPSLEECRKAFEVRLRQKIDWDSTP